MSKTGHLVLHVLAAPGEATVAELADQSGMKAITVRHHLTSLNATGLIVQVSRHQPAGPAMCLP